MHLLCPPESNILLILTLERQPGASTKVFIESVVQLPSLGINHLEALSRTCNHFMRSENEMETIFQRVMEVLEDSKASKPVRLQALNCAISFANLTNSRHASQVMTAADSLLSVIEDVDSMSYIYEKLGSLFLKWSPTSTVLPTVVSNILRVSLGVYDRYDYSLIIQDAQIQLTVRRGITAFVAFFKMLSVDDYNLYALALMVASLDNSEVTGLATILLILILYEELAYAPLIFDQSKAHYTDIHRKVSRSK
jgi:hypothetical protein